MPTFRTLFSGGELFGVGARLADWTHVDGFEIDPAVAAVARLNGFDVRTSDVREIDYEALVEVDHLHASPSCKSASTANTAGGETDEDLSCAGAICRAIHAHRGRSFSLENVWAYRGFESFARILAELHAEFVVDFRHVNAADFGVPQTRKRLILRAVRRSWRERVPGLRPTHSRRGGILVERWRGWYGAIADLIDTLPPTEPAPWQQARLPKALRQTTLIGAGGYDGGIVQREADEPTFGITANNNQSQIRAFIIGGGNTQLDQVDSKPRWDDEPFFTVTASDGAKKVARAFLLAGTKSPHGDGLIVRDDNAPAATTVAAEGGRIVTRAYLVSGQHARDGLTIREADSPVWAVVSGGSPGEYKAALEGRWVAMTVQPLGRFQTVPDDYHGLTPVINGNGVPCLLSRRIMESLL